METIIYLDYNATAPTRPEVIEAVTTVMATVANASSVHAAGREARKKVEAARAEVAALVGADPDNVIFTSGGTEADNLALKGFGKRRLIVSSIEHGAILAPALLYDAASVIVPVDGNGHVDQAALRNALADTDGPAIVSIMLANNETGVIQPMTEIAAIVHEYDALLHCDAVQAAGKIPVDIKALGVDMLSLASHKIGGPQGVGALVLREDRHIDAQIIGGGQERGRRSGTENVAGIVGFGVAARIAHSRLDDFAELAGLRDDMERHIKQIAPGVRVFGADVDRLPNTSCLTMPGVKSETQVMSFDLAGIAISAGSACSSGKVAASHVLEAMGVDEDEGMTAVRVSMGWRTKRQDIDSFIEAWREIHQRCGDAANAA